MKSYDVIIIGGGFFGLYLAKYYAEKKQSVLVLEKEEDFMKRASFNNQARVHNGYHYPRSIMTGARSKALFPHFVKEFEDCVDSSFKKYYAIGTILSKVTAKQFKAFCNVVGLQCDSVGSRTKNLFNSDLIEEVFETQEFAFNSLSLKKKILEKLNDLNVTLKTKSAVEKISLSDDMKEVYAEGEFYKSKVLFNATYSGINEINEAAGAELIPLKHEMTEMCMVEVPDELKGIGITIMCGPFFSVMPFPSLNCYSFSHVRYTPHAEWFDHEGGRLETHPKTIIDKSELTSNWKKMQYDAARYIPILRETKYLESLWETKTVLPKTEKSDARPILFKRDHSVKGFHCIMGGKIDNVYDVIDEIEKES